MPSKVRPGRNSARPSISNVGGQALAQEVTPKNGIGKTDGRNQAPGNGPLIMRDAGRHLVITSTQRPDTKL